MARRQEGAQHGHGVDCDVGEVTRLVDTFGFHNLRPSQYHTTTLQGTPSWHPGKAGLWWRNDDQLTCEANTRYRRYSAEHTRGQHIRSTVSPRNAQPRDAVHALLTFVQNSITT